MTKRVIVAGGRHLKDYAFLTRKLDAILSAFKLSEVAIISGGASGADSLGERYAREHHLQLIVVPALWSLGNKAGPIRNAWMAEIATHCVVFWNGRSPGTRSMIQIAKAKGLPLRVVRYEEIGT